jgi:hypothetical protein
MRRILICTGILGGGTALTFAAAALAATLLPGGTIVPANNGVFMGGGMVNKGGFAMPIAAPIAIDSPGPVPASTVEPTAGDSATPVPSTAP